LLSVAAPAASDRNPQDGSCGPVNRDANCLGALLLCCVLRRGPRRTSEPADRTTADPFWPDPKAGKSKGLQLTARWRGPETEGRFPAPGRDVSTAATPAVTRNASGVFVRGRRSEPSGV